MNKPSGSIHLDSLGASSHYEDMRPRHKQRSYNDLFVPSYCANSDLFKRPSNLWGQRTLSDEEYERQAESMRRFCGGPIRKRIR